MFKGKSIKEWQDTAEQKIKASKRKPLMKAGTFYFRIVCANYNKASGRLYITGIPFRINKNGDLVEYETITFYIPIVYTDDTTIEPFKELCSALDLDPDSEISLSAFKDKIVEVDIDIVDYVDDETGEVSKRFFNPDRFSKYQEQ